MHGPRQPFSLRSRLLLVASLVLFVFLGLMGVVLDQAFRRSAEQGVSERLLLHIYGLLAVTEQVDGELFLPDTLQEPGFNQLGTGLYAMVIDKYGKELWRSHSSLGLSLSPEAKVDLYANLVSGEPNFSRTHTVTGSTLFYLSYRILWQGGDTRTSTPYVFVVLQSLDTYSSEVSGFRNNLWGWLVGVVVVLIAVQAIVMNWGLSPLQRLAEDLKQIEDGEKEYLEGEYPAEIEGVTRNLNLLLASERQQSEHYRTTLADLAHSLKTPLAILKGAASSLSYPDYKADDVKDTVENQVDRMSEIVDYQLEQAVSAVSHLVRRPIALPEVAIGLVDAISQVYQSRDLEIVTDIAEDCIFFGDERDLMELLGNLLDNACKYGNGKVKLTASGVSGGKLVLSVEDDGEGIPVGARRQVLDRGARLDSREPGQGIGLAVVVSIARRYGGSVEIEDASLGGARVVVTF